jgi:hypothetical protein
MEFAMTTETATAKIEIPAVARDLAQRAVKTAQERADVLKANAEQATATIESAFNGSAATMAEVARALQGAIHDDVQAALASVEKMTAAKSLAEAAQIHVEFLGERGRVGLERMKSASDYLAKALNLGVKNVEEAIAKFTPGAALTA